MPPVVLWALGAIGATLVAKWLAREARRINAELHPEEPHPVDLGRVKGRKLEQDPETGIYRPK
jgi:hypothetical protein